MIPTPDSELYLLKDVELDPDYNYTIDFDTKQAQEAYFESKIDSSFEINEGYSFIRSDETIKVQANIEDLDGINYLMYKNGTRWHYGFILKKQYVNENVTRLVVKYDVYQTFMFDFEIDECFVDREHQDRKNILGHSIYNTQPENLEIGSDYDVKSTEYVDTSSKNSTNNELFYLIKAKEQLGNDFFPVTASAGNIPTSSFTGKQADATCQMGSVRTSIYLYLVPAGAHRQYVKILRSGGSSGQYNRNIWTSTFAPIEKLFEDTRVVSITLTRYLPDFYRGYGHDDEIGSDYVDTFDMTLVPAQPPRNISLGFCAYDQNTAYKLLMITSIPANEEIDNNLTMCKWRDLETSEITPAPQPLPDPTNLASMDFESKLETHPYEFLRVNANGETKDFKNENFTSNKNFSMYLSVGVNGGALIVPNAYNNTKSTYDALILKNKIEITLRSDKWLDYTLNNKASMNGGLVVSGLQTALGIGLGVATGGLGLAIMGGQALSFGGQIANEMLRRRDIKNQPDDLRTAISDSELISSITGLYVRFDTMTIKDTYKNKIYKYFMHYGYKCNEFKKPNTRSRYYFNYIKTIGANIKTNIDAEYKSQLAEMFDKGLTIWHYRDANTFKGVNNYDYENAEMALI